MNGFEKTYLDCDTIENSEYNIEISGNNIFFRDLTGGLLGYIRYHITSQNKDTLTVFINDTVTTYKYRENCSVKMQRFLEKNGISTYEIPGYGKIMTEILIRHFRTQFPGKTIYINFVSLDRAQNIHAIQNLASYIAKKCSDICTDIRGGNIENYTATLTLGIQD